MHNLRDNIFLYEEGCMQDLYICISVPLKKYFILYFTSHSYAVLTLKY